MSADTEARQRLQQREGQGPSCSVVIATYNRIEPLKRLLDDLAHQSVGPEAFEVVVVDDGSAVPVGPHLDKLKLPYRLRWVRQDNAGQAAARQRGVELAEGEVVVITDDDMELNADFLAAHLRRHREGYRVVLGHIKTPEEEASGSLLERFHLNQLKGWVEAVTRGDVEIKGIHVCTGNVSFRREDFLAVGGFDQDLKRSEDRELGVRFEKQGLRFTFAPEAVSSHHTDHDDELVLKRARLYGIYDSRIAKKHPDVLHADPWSFLFLVNPLSRPLLLLTVLSPGAGEQVEKAALRTARLLDAAGVERPALMGATLVYGLEYFRGMREEAGSFPAAARDLTAHLGRRALARPTAVGRFLSSVWGDFNAERKAKAKYFDRDIPGWRLPVDVVQKIGLQLMTSIRVMRLLRDSPIPLGGQIASRLIRHLYAAEIHWDAELAPGVALVHGNGLVISHAARVEEGCILFHNVTLGEGIDPETREVGGPHLEKNVHVGPGASLIGPITVGEGTKIMAGVTLMESVPPFSVVSQGRPEIKARDRRPKGKGLRHPHDDAGPEEME